MRRYVKMAIVIGSIELETHELSVKIGACQQIISIEVRDISYWMYSACASPAWSTHPR